FEFVVNKDLYEKIKNLKNQKNKNLSAIVRDIMLKMAFFLTKKHIEEPIRKKDYPRVNASKKIRTFLPEEVYNQLKMLHHQLNTFSMATLVREIMEVYFEGIEEYGEEKFMEIMKKVSEEIEMMRKNKVRVRKVGQDIPHSVAKLYSYLMFFSQNFYLTEFQFL
ncbi:MAG TPA: hypothetical protein PLD75_09885, partial [Spirochaetota bacterium]|nr:hypothetical protein [Spirochaetota bacterium]